MPAVVAIDWIWPSLFFVVELVSPRYSFYKRNVDIDHGSCADRVACWQIEDFHSHKSNCLAYVTVWAGF